MRCQNCADENSESNRFCGNCGYPLRKPQPAPPPASPVLSSFHEDVAQQQSELRSLEQNQAPTQAAPETNSPPLSKIATASADFGPATTVAPPVEPPRESAREWFSPPRGGRRSEPPITGPSFLGLSDPDGRSEQDLSYLYEDDYQGPNRARQWLVALIIIALLGFGYYQWRRDPAQLTRLNDWARQSIDSIRGTQASTQPSQPQSSTDSGAQPASGELAKTPNPASPVETQTAPATPVPSQEETSPTPPAVAKSTPPSGPQPEAAPPHTEASEPQPEQESTTATTETPVSKPSAMAAPAAVKHATVRTAPDADLVSKADEYLYGRGVPKSCDQALVYLRAAAEHGNSSARSKLGGLYATGNCVPLDRAQAYSWFSRALASGDHNVWIERNMTMLWNQMTPEEKSRIKR